MCDTKLQYMIKALDEYRNGTALVNLMDYCGVTNLYEVTQESAEIFYMLYNNIVNNSITISNFKIMR